MNVDLHYRMRFKHTNLNNQWTDHWPIGHFYSPYPDRNWLFLTPNVYEKSLYPKMVGIDLRTEAQKEFALTFHGYESQPKWEREKNAHRYFIDNGSFGYGDSLSLKAILARYQPRRYIEVGCGWSTAALLDIRDACKYDFDLHCIEPYPDTLNYVLRAGDKSAFTLYQEPLQEVPLELFTSLKQNDILFIDCSHVSKFGSDVNRLFFEILPQLNPGVVVHIHDIFYPFEYPRKWLFKEKRAWSEGYLLRAFLTFNPKFEILYWYDYLKIEHFGWLEENNLSHIPPYGAMWLRRVS